VRDRLLLRASALAYFSVLSMVPLLAIVVSVVGSLGVGERSRAWPSARSRRSPEAQAHILERVRDVNFAGLEHAPAPRRCW
jgi:uncharacterized BrkB/YihY/UPF0761 family membrane protein